MTLQNVEENVHLINLNSFNAFLVLCDVFSLASKGIKKSFVCPSGLQDISGTFF